MPNHVTNIVSMKGIATLDLFSKDGNHKSFDFNKIIPMPEELNVESGSEADNGIYIFCLCDVYFNGKVENPTDEQILEAFGSMIKVQETLGELNANTALNKNRTYFPHFQDLDRIKNLVYKIKENKQTNRLSSLFEKGKVFYSNVEKYGCADWHAWSCKHWGTKWNAYDTAGHGID